MKKLQRLFTKLVKALAVDRKDPIGHIDYETGKVIW